MSILISQVEKFVNGTYHCLKMSKFDSEGVNPYYDQDSQTDNFLTGLSNSQLFINNVGSSTNIYTSAEDVTNCIY